jgi:MATE family multidrug resistance protein
MSAASFRPSRADVRALLRLALPIVAVQLGAMAMGVVDTVMVGHFSRDAMAATALGNIYVFSVLLSGMGILMALDPLMSQAVGAGDALGEARAMQRGVVLVLAMTVPLSLLVLPAEPVLVLLRQPASIVPDAAAFVRISALGVAPFLLVTVMRQALQARHRMRPILVAILAANVLNAGLDWVLVFGHLGFPAMGAVGSAWATALSRWFLALFLAAVAWPELRRSLVPWRRDAFDVRALRGILALGLPIGVQVALEMGAFNVAGLLMGGMGETPLAGHTVALQLASTTFMVPLGIGTAASVLVGNAIGRGDANSARRAAGAGFLCGVAFMALSGAMFLSVPGIFAQAYTHDAAVVALAASLIPIAGVFQVFDGVQCVATGVLRGAGESRPAAAANLVGYWMVGLPFGWWLTTGAGLGPKGVWWGLTLGLAAVAVLLSWRTARVLRGEVRRIDVESPRPPAGA